MAEKTVGGAVTEAGNICVLIVFFIFLLFSSQALALTPLPFSAGDRLDGSWTVGVVVRHPEYIQLRLENRNGGEAAVEIAVNVAGSGEWATEHYKVQPVGDSDAPLTVLKAVLGIVRRYDSKYPSELFVSKVSNKKHVERKNPNSPDLQAFAIIDTKIGRNPVAGIQTLDTFAIIMYILLTLFFIAVIMRIVSSSVSATSIPAKLNRAVTFLIFWLLQLIPLILVAFLSFDIFESVSIVNSMDKAGVIENLRRTLAAENALNFTLDEKDGHLGYYRFGWQPEPGDNLACTVPNDFISLERSPEERAIYIFGGSPVLLPDPDNSMVDFVARRLSEKTGEKVRSYNFGMCGITSTSVADRAIEALKVPPDLLVIYNGVNDYSHCNNFVAWNYYVARQGTVFEAVLYFFYTISTRFLGNAQAEAPEEMVRSYYMQYFIEPVLNRILREVGFIKVDESLFVEAENVMFEHYLNKMRSIIETAGEAGVPVLMIPATGNFMEMPFGVDNEALHHYVKALESGDYNERAYHMMWAREGNYFNKLIRAKHPLYDRLYNLEYPNLYVFDLEYELLRAGFPFDYSSYIDQAHMKTPTHKYLADFIADYILANDLCCRM